MVATAEAPATSAVTPAAAEEPKTPSVAYAVAWVLAAVGIGGGIILSDQWDPAPFDPADGFSALALFYIVAQAIERAIEPFTGFVKAAPEGEAKQATKKEAEAKRNLFLAAAYVSADGDNEQTNVTLAAKWHAVVKEIRANTKVYAWGASTMLGALASGALGLYLLRAVGADATPGWLDVTITGVIIGGGSKALHDLMKGIETSKEKNEDPAEAK
ncbi:MAG: hypothetical protein M3406_15555 [Chloroflexota bacterium]|nr:hypothetical protein [Chloroflexota bacterium]